jgi:hypothetical protein
MAKNTAQQLLANIGFDTEHQIKQAHGDKNASATKGGPGRYSQHGAPGSRIGKARKIRAYVALTAAWAAKRITKANRRDEHGAYTMVGRNQPIGFHPDDQRRKWLAGISAQRGY